MTEHFLLKYRIKHTFHGCFHILDRIVDDSVQSDIHTLALGDIFCRSIRADIKSDDDRVGSRSQDHIRFVDSSHTSVDHLDHHFIVRKLEKALLQGFHRSLYVCFYYDIQFFQVAFLDLIEQIVKRHS